MTRFIFLILIAWNSFCQVVYAQSEEYSNQLMPTYFADGNTIMAPQFGFAAPDRGVIVGFDQVRFFKNALGFSSALFVRFLDSQEETVMGARGGFRFYPTRMSIRPLIDISTGINMGTYISCSYMITTGISYGGLFGEMLGLDLFVSYDQEYESWNYNDEPRANQKWFMPRIGMHFQW